LHKNIPRRDGHRISTIYRHTNWNTIHVGWYRCGDLFLSNLPGSNAQVEFVFLAKIDNAQIISSIINTLYYGKKNEVGWTPDQK
jgi:hypothetical protein